MKIATLCFPVGGDKVYLSLKKRSFGAGFLLGYGGKMGEDDKTVEDAAAREFAEESGAVTAPEALEKVAVVDFFEEEKHLFECHVFFVRKWEGELVETEEMAAPELHPFNNLPYDRMWKGDIRWLPLIFSGQRIKAKVTYFKEMNEVKDFSYEPLT